MNKKLYVGNLSFETSDAQLEELFGKAGKVENVRVMRDMDTGRGRGIHSSDGRIGQAASSTRATGRCAERKNAAVALLDEIIRRESVWLVRSVVRAGLLFGCTRFLTRNNRSYCRGGWI